MNLNPQEIAALDADVQMMGAFVRINTSPLVAIWLGASAIQVGINTIDKSGQVYQGCGMLPTIPAFKSLLNGRAERIDLSVSGVSDRLLAVATSDINNVRGRACDVGIGIFDKTWSLLGPVRWLRHGIVDSVKIVRAPPQSDGSGPVQSVVISMGSLGTGIKRRAYAFWTDQDQQGRSPGDRFCERTTAMSLIAQKVFPRF